MANTKSAQKAARQTIRRTAVNKSRRTEMRTYVRKVEEAIASKDPKAAAEALSAAEPMLARAAQKASCTRTPPPQNLAPDQAGQGARRLTAAAARADVLTRAHPPMTDVPPNRLSVDPSSPFYDEAALARGIGVAFAASSGGRRGILRERAVDSGGGGQGARPPGPAARDQDDRRREPYFSRRAADVGEQKSTQASFLPQGERCRLTGLCRQTAQSDGPKSKHEAAARPYSEPMPERPS